MDHKELKISDFDFLKSLDTRWRDMDAIQHINNATILSYFETVRVAFLNNLGFSVVRRQSKGVILASMKIDYFSQLSCLLYTSPSPRDLSTSRMPSSA